MIEFLYSALLGIGAGVFFDLLKVIRTYTSKKKWVTGLFDAVFWIVTAIALFAFILTVSGGKMRWYVLVGIFCGAFVYRAAASEIVFKVLKGTSDLLIRLLQISTKPLYLFLVWLRDFGRKAKRRACAKVAKRKQNKRGRVDKSGNEEKKKKEHIS